MCALGADPCDGTGLTVTNTPLSTWVTVPNLMVSASSVGIELARKTGPLASRLSRSLRVIGT